MSDHLLWGTEPITSPHWRHKVATQAMLAISSPHEVVAHHGSRGRRLGVQAPSIRGRCPDIQRPSQQGKTAKESGKAQQRLGLQDNSSKEEATKKIHDVAISDKAIAWAIARSALTKRKGDRSFTVAPSRRYNDTGGATDAGSNWDWIKFSLKARLDLSNVSRTRRPG
jgi:hypothetical protein